METSSPKYLEYTSDPAHSSENGDPAALFHADDFGITVKQARAVLALCGACGGHGALGSVSIFSNSPAFDQAALLARPFVEEGKLLMGLHLNLVEGRPCSPPADIPLLVGERGTFAHSFTGLLKLSRGPQRNQLQQQLQRECRAQLERFLEAFPQQRTALRLDSHQHTHAIPQVLDALLAAARTCGCTLSHVRTPVEPLSPHLASPRALLRISPVNLAKDALLTWLWRANRDKLPAGCATSLFCGVVLSGRMDRVDDTLVSRFATLAQRRNTKAELLFHPVSVPVGECLDPGNQPFAAACASPGRDAEARTLRQLEPSTR